MEEAIKIIQFMFETIAAKNAVILSHKAQIDQQQTRIAELSKELEAAAKAEKKASKKAADVTAA